MQDLPRLYVRPLHAEPLQVEPPQVEPWAAGSVLPMTDGQAHYLGTVMRRQPGDGVRLFNARDGEWSAVIEALRKERGRFRLDRQLRPPAPEPGPILLFAPLKRDATDLVVRMATELGAATLQPVITERTISARINAERWTVIATEAAEQCERLSVPAIAGPVRLAELLGAWDPGRMLLVALERAAAAAGRLAAWRARAAASPSALRPGLVLGPAGGVAGAERALLRSRPFMAPGTLGPRILRAETAALAGLALLGG